MANSRSEDAIEGRTVGYLQYREAFSPKDGVPIHWTWASILDALARTPQGERGSLTLTTNGDALGCQLLPGVAINVQVVPAGERTRPHAHSWWHLFFVRAGGARAVLKRHAPRALAEGDLLLVPAWTEHHFENDSSKDLVLLSMSNLPQQAALSNHRAQEPEEAVDT